MKTIRLGDLCDINPESIKKNYDYEEIKYIDISSVGTGTFIDDPKVLPLNEAPSRAKRIVKDGDTILATVRPNLRSFLYVKNPDENTIASTGFAVLRAKKNADSRYIYYSVTNKSFTGYLTNNAKGTSYPAVDTDIVGNGVVPYFSLPTQKRIADILSTYDDLIENNNRRISLLEQSARHLYKEWFVRFKFPGHEKVNVVDGVPEGWERKTLGEVCELKYGKALKALERIEGAYEVYGSSGVVGTHNQFLVEGPGIILGRKGNIGSTYWAWNNFYPIDTVYFISKKKSNFWLYLTLEKMTFVNSDVAVPGLNRNYAYSRGLVVPSKCVSRFFIKEVSPVFDQIKTVNKYNEKLKEARGLLLPRLMNGTIQV